ncbi:MAG: DNA polymerase III subunit alpha [Bacillota bacterium]|jgi:error-prone DNA polymerase|nr:DNA polymerase III subunit alpha [Candidatus Fermentithermobacillaceae bacterium]
MFLHLHVHSPYSFLDGASGITKLVERAADLGMPAIALTDHNKLSGSVRFIKAAQKAGIKPIIGCEVTMEGGFHLTVLCQNNTGYRNLCAVLTQAHLGNERESPMADLHTLASHKEGLFVLSGCRKGLIPSLILQKRFKEARQTAEYYKHIFGQESFVIELSESLLPGSMSLNKSLSELAASLNLPTVVTNNVHYATKEDFQIHDILTCIRTLTKLEDVHPERRLNSENYLKSSEEMKAEYKGYPEAFYMTRALAEQCECPLELRVQNFPAFAYPKGFKSSNHFLRHLVFQGAGGRYGKITHEVKARLEHELSIIGQLGYEDYFLVVWDLVNFAARQNIRHAGRGSAADSAVAYCLGITDVDPIAHNLLFERFMSLERGEKPDIDVDFDARRRDEVTAYVYKKYGDAHVASVATYNTFQARSSVRDVGKAMGYAQDEIGIIAKRLPHIPGYQIENAFKSLPELKSLDIPEKRLKTLIETAGKLSGLPRFLSTHLGGVVISKTPVTWLSPLELSAKGVNILQFDKDDVEDLGLVKIDLLSLRTLGAVEDSLGFIEGTKLDYDRIPLDDKATFRRLQYADTIGIFQLESPAQRGLQARLGAENIEDIVASVALIRPGPIKGDMVEPFIRRRHGEEDITYLDSRLEPILKNTYGVVLFQEQVIEIASVIAGFTPGEADKLRRVMTHGRSFDEMEKIGRLFIEKAVKRGVTEQVAAEIFKCIRGYASYGFCEAHARAFATTAYKTAYLIEHYPAEFYGSILNNQPMGFYPVSTICVEAKNHGVEVLGPSINHSGKDVAVTGLSIRIPFKMISGMKQNAITSIIRERAKGKFKSFYDFTRRVKLDSDILRNLILCGCFDEFGISRKSLLWQAKDACMVADSTPPQAEMLLALPDPVYCTHKAAGVPGQMEFSLGEKVAFEYQILGTGVSAHPMEIWRGKLRKQGFIASRELSSIKPGDFVKAGGIPVRPHRPPTKSGRTVVFLSLEDEYGLTDITCFENVYAKYGKFLFPGKLMPLGVWGQVQKRGNGFSVTAKTVFPLSYVLS